MHLTLTCTRTCKARSTDAHLRRNVDRLNRITDGLQKDVSYIMTAMTSSGIQSLEFGNRTRTDTNSEGITAELNETVNDVKELKSEFQGLILHSRNGFKNEKTFQREVIREINERYEAFQTDQTERNREMNDDIERLLTGSAEVNSRVDRLDTMLENLSVKQNSLESENQELKQELTDMQENFNVKQNSLRSENQELKQKLIDMQENLAHVGASVGLSTCEKGWIRFHGSCYLFVDQIQTWADAVATCRAKGSYLVEVTTDSELEFVRGERKQFQYLKWAEWAKWEEWAKWIGATDEEHEGRFVFHHSKRPVPNTFWHEGEPNNVKGIEHCVVLFAGYETFYDVPCTYKFKYVCERPVTPIEQ